MVFRSAYGGEETCYFVCFKLPSFHFSCDIEHMVIEPHTIDVTEEKHYSLRSLDKWKTQLQGNSYVLMYGSKLSPQSSIRH